MKINIKKQFNLHIIFMLTMFVALSMICFFIIKNSYHTAQKAKAASDFQTQLIKATIPANQSSVSILAPDDFTPINPQETISLISGIQQQALGTIKNSAQLPKDVHTYVELTNSQTLTVSRSDALNESTTVWILLIEYTGPDDGANQFVIRDRRGIVWNQNTVNSQYGPINSVINTDKVVVFNSGMINPSDQISYHPSSDILSYIDSNKSIQLRRGVSQNTNTKSISSHQVVEFIGSNWSIQKGLELINNESQNIVLSDLGSLSNSWIYATSQTQNQDIQHRSQRLRLTSPTNLRIESSLANTGQKQVYYSVITNPFMQVQTNYANNQFGSDLSVQIDDFSEINNDNTSFAWVSGYSDTNESNNDIDCDIETASLNLSGAYGKESDNDKSYINPNKLGTFYNNKTICINQLPGILSLSGSAHLQNSTIIFQTPSPVLSISGAAKITNSTLDFANQSASISLVGSGSLLTNNYIGSANLTCSGAAKMTGNALGFSLNNIITSGSCEYDITNLGNTTNSFTYPSDAWQFGLNGNNELLLERGYAKTSLYYAYQIIELPGGSGGIIEQSGYHWKNNDGDEVSAQSATDQEENTPLLNATSQAAYRLRLQIANTGSQSSIDNKYRLEYGRKNENCHAITEENWFDIGAEDSAWNLYDSIYIENGQYSTNIATENGGIIDKEGYSFKESIKGIYDQESQTNSISLQVSQYIELEYSIISTINAIKGNSYCFRITNEGNPLDNYANYPEIQLFSGAKSIAEAGKTLAISNQIVTISLENPYTNMIVVASPRYNPTIDKARSVRILSKQNGEDASFTLKVDNATQSLDETDQTIIDWFVIEKGVNFIFKDNISQMIIADSVPVSGTLCKTGKSGQGTNIHFSPNFTQAPIVLHTISSNNSQEWVTSHISSQDSTSTPPQTKSATLFLQKSFLDCNHNTNEQIDYIALEPGYGMNNGVEYQVGKSDLIACCNDNGYPMKFNQSFLSEPNIAIVSQMGEIGGDGGYALIHTGGNELTKQQLYASIDEDGPNADRSHTNETIGALILSNSGIIIAQDPIR